MASKYLRCGVAFSSVFLNMTDKVRVKLLSMFKAASGDVRRLDNVVRFSSIPTVVNELVSTHQYWVGLYSALLHSAIRPDDKHLLGRIMIKASTHDILEGWTGDFVRTFKYSSEKLRNAIDEAEVDLIKSLPPEIKSLYEETEDDETEYIKDVVKTADFLSLQQYMFREWMLGNRTIKPFYERMINDLIEKRVEILDKKGPFHLEMAELFSIMIKNSIEA